MDTDSIQVLVIYSLDCRSAFFCDIMESISESGRETEVASFYHTFLTVGPYCHISELG